MLPSAIAQFVSPWNDRQVPQRISLQQEANRLVAWDAARHPAAEMHLRCDAPERCSRREDRNESGGAWSGKPASLIVSLPPGGEIRRRMNTRADVTGWFCNLAETAEAATSGILKPSTNGWASVDPRLIEFKPSKLEKVWTKRISDQASLKVHETLSPLI